MIRGIPVSMGVAFGKPYLIDRSNICILKEQLPDDKIEEEIERFRIAIKRSKSQLQEIKERTGKGAEKYGVILDTYSLLLEDEILVNDTIENIKIDGVNAEFALNSTLEKFMSFFDNINDEYLKGKKDDLELVVQRILRNLLGHNQESLEDINEPVILVAHQLSPSDMLVLNKNHIKGMVTEAGGKTSHVGIIASAMGIPAVVGAKEATSKINTGDTIIVDGIDGTIVVNPTQEELDQYTNKKKNYRDFEEKLLEDISLPAETKDGHRVELMANIESVHEIKALSHFGAEGIGLYRTEFLYMGRKKFPNEMELYENFRKVVEQIKPNPVTIRTLDIGGDKMLHAVGLEEENNPALGLRGIRMSLTYPELMMDQLKAILRASHYGKAKILYPMISFTDEILDANQLLEQAKNELRAQEIPFDEKIEIGAMIETPASAICVDHILEVVDFISIGTNDLIQYVLAVDRINENVAHLYQPFHPSIIKTLKLVFDAANRVGKKVSICGELGGDPLATQLILGLGKVDQLSMDPHSIPWVKKMIRNTNLKDADDFSKHLLSLTSTEEINGYINQEMRRKFPDDFDRNLNFGENS